MDLDLTLPNGEVLPGSAPIVVLGPNGSGKTRQSRNIASPSGASIEVINALRNTRVTPEVPVMAMGTARQQFEQNKSSARYNHWELSGEFDAMLSRMLGEHSSAAMEFVQRFNADPTTAGEPQKTALTKVEELWAHVFPGRELFWSEWRPMVRNNATGAQVEYSGNQMSDGEKAALFLMARVFSAPEGIVIVDEPETHLHSLLAVRLWDAIEGARPDIRFVFVTHDLTFALSRNDARYVLASPNANPALGLRVIDVDNSLPDDVSEALLGSASLSFYASRVVFCEGNSGSFDEPLYNAWFNGPDTVVKPVDGCQRVLRCVDALRNSGIASALEAVGVVDGDYHPDSFRNALPDGVFMLKVHEIESLLSLPDVVAAVRRHVSAPPLDHESYKRALVATVDAQQRKKIIVDRWKRRLEPSLEGLMASVSRNQSSVDELLSQLPEIFDHTTWNFSPADMLREEQQRVESALSDGADVELLLAIAPGKQMLPVAAHFGGLEISAYVKLVVGALSESGTRSNVSIELERSLVAYLPVRRTVPAGVVATPA